MNKLTTVAKIFLGLGVAALLGGCNDDDGGNNNFTFNTASADRFVRRAGGLQAGQGGVSGCLGRGGIEALTGNGETPATVRRLHFSDQRRTALHFTVALPTSG